MPIRTPLFKSNWELSSQRGINVLNALQSRKRTRDLLSERGIPFQPGKFHPHPAREEMDKLDRQGHHTNL